MRAEQEMLTMIRETALRDPRIRAAYLEGSRANPMAPRDLFQDYDVVYLVEETRSFRDDPAWIDRFGPRLYMQLPELGVYFPSDPEHCWGWLIQFSDGNRMDLHVCTLDTLERRNEEPFIVLLDKDGLFPNPPAPSDQCYWVQRPDQPHFSCACNNFWWCMNNVAKGLWRNELPYVMDMLNFQVRPMLRRLLEWKIGLEHAFSVSAGKSAKYMNRYLPESLCQRYLDTFSPAQTEAVWNAVFLMCDLFDEIAEELSAGLNLSYNRAEARGSRGFLEHVRALPPDAKEIY